MRAALFSRFAPPIRSVPGPLSHLTILDLSRVLAGPWCTQLLADLGATVIKVERPGVGDDTRAWGPPYLKDEGGRDTGEAAYYLSCNRGKLSVAVDFTTSDGQRIVRDLARQSDVLVENYKVGGLAQYGLDYATIAAASPRLVYASITGFGQNGPYADRAGYDFIIQGMSGFMSVTGERDDLPGGGPQKAGIAITDLMTGMFATVAIQAALAHRDRTGKGQWIDTCLFDSAVAMMAVMNHQLPRHRDATRTGRQCAPEHRALRGLRVRRRPRDPRGRQRRPVREILRGGGPADRGRRTSASRRTPIACVTAPILVPLVAEVMRTRTQHAWLAALGGAGRALRADQPHRSGVRRSADSGARLADGSVASFRRQRAAGRHADPVFGHAG